MRSATPAGVEGSATTFSAKRSSISEACIPGLLENLPAYAPRRPARRRLTAPGVAGEFDRQPEGLHFAGGGMLDHGHHVARLGLRVRVHLLHGEHRPGRHARLLQQAQAIPLSMRCWKWDVSAAISSGMLAMRPALSAKRGSSAMSGASSTSRNWPHVFWFGGAERDPAVLGLERLVGRAQGMRRAERAGRHAGREGDGRLPVGLDDAGLEQRGVDALALAGLELVRVGGVDADAGEQAGGDVGDGRRRP